MAPHAQDDAFREIQLNGKQLVFLFMVATVVSVVIFLCGVFVGRGVRADRPGMLADVSTVAPITTPDVTPAATASPRQESDPSATPPPAVDELSYFKRLEQPGQSAEALKTPDGKASAAKAAPDAKSSAENRPVADKAAPAAKPAAEPAAPVEKTPAKAPALQASSSAPPAAASASDAQPAAAPAGLAEPKTSGYALQVTALRERGEAEAVAKRLTAKGYTAYVMSPSANGAPNYYRVRIGKFQTRREAEDIASKLQKEEQIKPWITR